jgi:hypothetical protein
MLSVRLKGNPVEFGDGPAAVIGDERRLVVNRDLLIVICNHKLISLTPLEIVIVVVGCFSK